MRTLLFLLFLACSAYAAWFYWQQYNDTPLQTRLLLAETADITLVRVGERPNEAAFALRRTDDNGWVVSREHTQLLDQSERVTRLIGLLTKLQTDSIAYQFVDEDKAFPLIVHSGTYGAEALHLALPPEGPALALRQNTQDVFALPREALVALLPALRFNHYREQRLLNLAAERVDSLVASYHDSLLWRMDQADSLPTLAQTFIAPAAAPYADYFDEIADQEFYYATMKLYAGGKAHEVTVFRDSLWPLPYVVVGEDFPRRYLGLAGLR